MQSALAQAYRQYFPLLVRKCTRMLGDTQDAEDVAQESFVRLHRASLTDAPPLVVTAWLYRTSTRLAIDRLRARARLELTATELEPMHANVNLEDTAQARALWAWLADKIPEEELEAALLSRVDGLTQPEVAEVLGIHERSVRRLLTRFEERATRLRARSES